MKVLSVSSAKSRLGRVIDQVIKTHEPIEEDAELIGAIQEEVRKYRSEKRRRK